MALDVATRRRAAGHDLVLMTTDPPLLRAARREGLTTFNPERQTQAELDALIAS
jgi:3-hydroxyisobutyrate dehydrogenase-like beta-hydroxyacid dehydrogenase